MNGKIIRIGSNLLPSRKGEKRNWYNHWRWNIC